MKIDQELTKLYYSIGEVSELFGVSTSLIRYWEGEFNSLKPYKNRRGDRRFTPKDIRQLEKIYNLVKERGFTLDGAKSELKAQKQREAVREDLLKKLNDIKSRLEAINEKIKS